MSNTITAYFKGRTGVAESVYQNDYGIVMAFDGIYLPAHFDCYFSVTGSNEAIPGIGADNRVAIPNSVLAKSGKVEIHIPLHTGESDSEVEYVVYFKVIGRARPVDDGTPEQMTAIEQALALLQTPIENIETIVNEALSFTGDTFDDMQAALDADQAAFKSEIRGDIDNVESDFDNLNAQFQTALSAVTVDDELLNVRVGDDNVTYLTAGEAVRNQFSAVTSRINSLSESVDVTVLPLVRLIIDENNKWLVPENNRNCVFIPINGGESYTIYTTNPNGFNYAILQTNQREDGTDPDFCDGYEQRYLLSQYEKASFQTPDDAHFLYVRCDTSSDAQMITVQRFANAKKSGELITKSVDLSACKRVKMYVNSENNTANDGEKYSVFIPVNPGDYVEVTVPDSYGSVYSVLKSDEYTIGSAPDVSSLYPSRVLLTQGRTYQVAIPSDAHYFLLRADFSTYKTDFNVKILTPFYEYLINKDKQYNEQIEAVETDTTFIETIVPSQYNIKPSRISAQGLWIDGGGQSIVLPCVPGEKFKIKTTFSYGMNIALLKDANWIPGGAVNFCSGYSGIVEIIPNIEYEIITPNDCHVIVLRVDSTDDKYSITRLMSNKVKNTKQDKTVNKSNKVYVAASDSSVQDKAKADYICTGTNDEITLRDAIMVALRSSETNSLASEIVLMPGNYSIDSFPYTNSEGCHVAIMLPSVRASDTIGSSTYACTIKGAVHNGGYVRFVLSETCYNALNTTDFYSVIATQSESYFNHFALHDIQVIIPHGLKKIICIDGHLMGSLELRRCRCIVADHAVWTTPVEEIVMPNLDCIGVRGAEFDSNTWSYIWESVYCAGFGQGFAVTGEHLIMMKCVAIYGKYGFTFHNYYSQAAIQSGTTSSHPITMIGCTDEANANFWLFGDNNQRKPIINCYDLSIEFWSQWFQIAGEGHYATEKAPGQFGGFISYAISGGDVDTPWWANGSGHNFTSINLNQSKQTNTVTRQGYAPNMGQQIFDTDLNKLLICTDPYTKEWRDALGNIV